MKHSVFRKVLMMRYTAMLMRQQYEADMARILYLLRIHYIFRLILEEYTRNNGFGFYVYFGTDSDSTHSFSSSRSSDTFSVSSISSCSSSDY